MENEQVLMVPEQLHGFDLDSGVIVNECTVDIETGEINDHYTMSFYARYGTDENYLFWFEDDHSEKRAIIKLLNKCVEEGHIKYK